MERLFASAGVEHRPCDQEPRTRAFDQQLPREDISPALAYQKSKLPFGFRTHIQDGNL